MKLLLLIISFIVAGESNAQFWKEKVNQAKETAKQRAEQKVDEKMQTGIDQGVEKADSVVTGKKKIFGKKKKNGKKNTGNNDQEEDENESGVFVIKTNIYCDAGKQLIEQLLRDEDGITSAAVDTGTGKAFIMSATDSQDIYNKIVSIICKKGFTADGKKATAKTNACQ